MKQYEQPKFQVLLLDAEDIIATSGTSFGEFEDDIGIEGIDW